MSCVGAEEVAGHTAVAPVPIQLSRASHPPLLRVWELLNRLPISRGSSQLALNQARQDTSFGSRGAKDVS